MVALLIAVGPAAGADPRPTAWLGAGPHRAYPAGISARRRGRGGQSHDGLGPDPGLVAGDLLGDVDDLVEKDSVLVQLKDTEHRARLAQAAAELKSASARLEQARDEHQRVAGLFAKNNVSASAMDQAKAELTAAQARLDSTQAALHQAREQLAYTQIRAPYSGIVTERHVEIGEVAGPGQPVMKAGSRWSSYGSAWTCPRA